MRAIVIGHTGQDGKLLCQSLINRGYEILGFSRRDFFLSGKTNSRLEKPLLEQRTSIYTLLEDFQPNEVYYLAAHHRSSEQVVDNNLHDSFFFAEQTHVFGLLNFLCAIKDLLPDCRLFYASSSLIFDGQKGPNFNEVSPLTPKGFYGITKAQGMWLCHKFRHEFGIFASVGILFNHESYLRPAHFLSQKIIQTAIRIANGSKEKLVIGDLSARVDWGYAPDYVEAFQTILQHNESEDFIVATGEAHAVGDFVNLVFESLGLKINKNVIEDNSILQRKSPIKIGDFSKLKDATGWRPSLSFEEFVKQLVRETLTFLKV